MKIFKTIAVALVLVFLISVVAQAALTISITRTIGDTDDAYRIRDFTVAFDSSYPTGGESLSAANMALSTIHNVNCQTKGGYVFEYDYGNSTLLAYDVSGNGVLHQSEDTTDLSAVTGVRCRAYGK